MKTICLLFSSVPNGTHYSRGAYSWVKESLARQYIAEGYAKEYNPTTKKLVSTSPYTDVLQVMSKKSGKRRKFS